MSGERQVTRRDILRMAGRLWVMVAVAGCLPRPTNAPQSPTGPAQALVAEPTALPGRGSLTVTATAQPVAPATPMPASVATVTASATATEAATVAPTDTPAPVPAVTHTALPVPASSQRIDHTCVNPGGIPVAYLDLVRQLKVFFCHHSVGNDIMAGVADLAAHDAGRYSIATGANVGAEWFDSRAGIGHRAEGYGRNFEPDTKTAAFNELMRGGGYGARAQVAFMKLCYVDLPAPDPAWGWGRIAPERVWEEYYRPTMEGLERAFPEVILVWWTCPLLSATHGHGNNHKATYNALVRDYCATRGKWLLDIAAIESHRPDGMAVRDGAGFEAMHDAYTHDGGHLNGEGRLRVARALWCLLARVTGWAGAA